MKHVFKFLITLLLFITVINITFAQTPNLGTAANFALFTSVGAITNTGISHITGHVGSNSGAGTGFGNVNGVMHSGNGTTAQCAADLIAVYNQLNAAIPNYFVAPLLGNGDTLVPGVYHTAGATVLSGNLILNAQGNPNAVFIFQIQGAFSTSASSKVKLINGAMACNVFWKVEGLVNMATQTYMRGAIVANNAAIIMSALDTLEGHALSTSGGISVNGVVVSTPIGCGSPILTGPLMPTLGSAACYTLFTSNGSMTNAGVSSVTGDVGTNVGLTTGFNPLLVNGTIHPIPDGSTAAAAADLLNAANLMNIMPYDIELLYPAQFGNDLVLTPHTYVLNAGTSLTGNLYLNAQGNTNAIFFIKIYGALSTSVSSHVILMNGAQADNVYWLVSGATGIDGNSVFNGNLIGVNGAISTLSTGVQVNGRLLTTNGAFSTTAISAISLSPCFALPVTWLYFNGQAQQHEVKLTWGTSNEVNNNYFLIEKSKDGILFETLGKVNAKNENIQSKKEYTLIDHSPLQTNYYRIAQVDIDGRINVYKTIKVNAMSNDLIVTHQTLGTYIEVSIANASSGKGYIELFTAQGEMVSSTAIEFNNVYNEYQIRKPLQNGLYILRVIVNNESVYTRKVILN